MMGCWGGYEYGMDLGMTKKTSDISLLEIVNEKDEVLNLIIEPHLELYEIPPNETCVVFDRFPTDNAIPNRTLTIAYRKDGIVVYSPSEIAPEIRVNNRKLVNLWG